MAIADQQHFGKHHPKHVCREGISNCWLPCDYPSMYQANESEIFTVTPKQAALRIPKSQQPQVRRKPYTPQYRRHVGLNKNGRVKYIEIWMAAQAYKCGGPCEMLPVMSCRCALTFSSCLWDSEITNRYPEEWVQTHESEGWSQAHKTKFQDRSNSRNRFRKRSEWRGPKRRDKSELNRIVGIKTNKRWWTHLKAGGCNKDSS